MGAQPDTTVADILKAEVENKSWPCQKGGNTQKTPRVM